MTNPIGTSDRAGAAMAADRTCASRSKSANQQAYEHSDAGKGDTDVPKGDQEKLEFARIS